MASESPVQDLCEEITCPICLEYFKDPVTVDCGHNFCQACITQCWGEPGGDASCPQCREPCQPRSLKPSRQLASIVEIAKKFRLQMTRGAEALGRVCGRHQEPLKLFCEDDQALICVVCDKSKEHRAHKVIPKEEALEEYKDKILSHLEFLNKERERILVSKQNVGREGQNLLIQTKVEREKIVAEFKQLHQFLEEQEAGLLAKLKDLEDEIKATENKHMAKLSDEMSSMENLVRLIEEKQKQPADELLQDIRSILQSQRGRRRLTTLSSGPAAINTARRMKRFLNQRPGQAGRPTLAQAALVAPAPKKAPTAATTPFPREARSNAEECTELPAFPPELKKEIEKFSRIHPLLKPVIETFRDTVLSRLRANEEGSTEDMTVPRLVLSSARQTKGGVVGFPTGFGSRTSTYYCWSSTMGTERINSGRHSWMVDVGQRRFWTVGVAKEDLREQNQIHLSPEQGVWAVGKLSLDSDPLHANDDTYCAFASPGVPLGQFWVPTNFQVHPCVSPTRIRVSLNYDEGSVTFSDADDQHNTIYTFRNASFAGAKLCSWLSMGEMLKWQCHLPHSR